MKFYNLLIAASVALSTVACGDEITNNYYTTTEGSPPSVTEVKTSTTIVIRETNTITATTSTTTVMNVIYVTNEITTIVNVTTPTTSDEPDPETPIPGTIAVTPLMGTLSQTIEPYADEAARLNWRLDTSKSGVIRGMALETAPTRPGTNNTMGWFLRGCVWSFSVNLGRGMHRTTQVPCREMGNWLVMDQPVYIEQGVPVTMMITGNVNAFAPSSNYTITVRDLVMDDGQDRNNTYSVITTGNHMVSHTMSNDTTCLGLMTSPDMNQLLVTSTNTPTQVDVSSGTSGRVADVTYHACRLEVTGQYQPLAYLYMVHTNPGTGGGFHAGDGRNMLVRETSYQTSSVRSYGGTWSWRFVAGGGPDVLHPIEMLSLGMGSEITLGLDVECDTGFVGGEYNVYLRYWRNAPGYTDTLIGRFRCVE